MLLLLSACGHWSSGHTGGTGGHGIDGMGGIEIPNAASAVIIADRMSDGFGTVRLGYWHKLM
jgi:hypothetical protein